MTDKKETQETTVNHSEIGVFGDHATVGEIHFHHYHSHQDSGRHLDYQRFIRRKKTAQLITWK